MTASAPAPAATAPTPAAVPAPTIKLAAPSIVELKRQQLVDAKAAFDTHDAAYQALEHSLPDLRTALQGAEQALLARTNEKSPRDEAVTRATQAHDQAQARVQPAVEKEADEKIKSDTAEERLSDLRDQISRAFGELGIAMTGRETLLGSIATAEGLLTEARRKLDEARTAKAASAERVRAAEEKAAASLAASTATPAEGYRAKARAKLAALRFGTPAAIAAADALAVAHAKDADAINQATFEGLSERVDRENEALNGADGLKSKLPAAEHLVTEKQGAHDGLKNQEAGLAQTATDAANAYRDAQADASRKKADAAAKLSEKEEAVRLQGVAAQAITEATATRDAARNKLAEEEAKVEPARIKRAELETDARKAESAIELAIAEEAQRKAVKDLGNVVSLTVPGADNMGKGDSFDEQQIKAIVQILNDQLKRSGGWGDRIHHTLSHDKDKIIFDNRIKPNRPGTFTKQVIVNPRVIDIKGDMDDKTIQAALIAAQALWGNEGIQIKTIDPWLKSRMLANADHLHKLGKIKKYKTKTLFGSVGEGFANAKGITAPRDTWRFGTKGITYRHRLDCLENGLESNTLRPVKWWKLGGMRNGISAAAPAPGKSR